MSNELAVPEAQPTEFSATELAALRERRDAVASQWVAAVRAEATGKEGEVALEAGLSTETVEKIERFQREYQALSASVKTGERAKEQGDLVRAGEELTSNAPRYRDLQAKREAKFYEDLMSVGQGQYRNEKPDDDPRGGAHPGSLPVPQPLIAKDASGRNRVHPFAAVFAKDGDNRAASVEASFRLAEIIQADKFGKYVPATGEKVDGHNEPVGRQLEALLGFDQAAPGVDQAVADTYLTQGGQLYLYEIQRNELAQYMDIKQVPYVNDFIIDRRVSVGTLANHGLIEESGTIPPLDSDFDTITIRPRKFGFLKGMSYESSRLQEPWSVAETIMTDAGILMGNTFGELIVVGDGSTGDRMAEEWQGLKTWALANASHRSSLGANANFLPATRSAQSFGIYQMATFLTSLPKEYFRAPNKLLSMKLSVWGKLMGARDGEDRRLFDSNSSLEDMTLAPWNIRVVLDENWDEGTTANQVPWFYGDFTSACFVMYRAGAGGLLQRVRVHD